LPAVVAGAVLLALDLAGCSFVDDAGQVWGIVNSDFEKQRSLARAVSALELLEGVESASSNFTAAGLSGAEAELHVIVRPGTTPEQARSISSTTREAFGAPELEGVNPLFTLRGNGAADGVLTRNCFDLSDGALADVAFAADFAYWRAGEIAVGAPLSMSLTPSATGEACDRGFTAPDQGDAGQGDAGQGDAVRTAELLLDNFEALAAVPDETQNATMWEFAGMLASPHLPSAELVGLLDDIHYTIPLIDYSQLPENPAPDIEYPEGVLLAVNKFAPEQPVVAEIMISQQEYRNADWQNAIAAGALATRVPDLSFRYVMPERQFQLHTSTCEGTVNESSDDQKFFDAIVAYGAKLLPGAGPGTCVPER
jgi:hypothetical protein